jgi:hypothetical protein
MRMLYSHGARAKNQGPMAGPRPRGGEGGGDGPENRTSPARRNAGEGVRGPPALSVSGAGGRRSTGERRVEQRMNGSTFAYTCDLRPC